VEKEINTDSIAAVAKNLNQISEKLSETLNKIDSILASFENYQIKNNFSKDPLLEKLDKLIEVIEKNQNNQKIDILLNKFDTFLSKNSSNNFIIKDNNSRQELNRDIPVFVPEISLSDVSKTNIRTKEISSEGTDDILEKLKKLKKGV